MTHNTKHQLVRLSNMCLAERLRLRSSYLPTAGPISTLQFVVVVVHWTAPPPSALMKAKLPGESWLSFVRAVQQSPSRALDCLPWFAWLPAHPSASSMCFFHMFSHISSRGTEPGASTTFPPTRWLADRYTFTPWLEATWSLVVSSDGLVIWNLGRCQRDRRPSWAIRAGRPITEQPQAHFSRLSQASIKFSSQQEAKFLLIPHTK